VVVATVCRKIETNAEVGNFPLPRIYEQFGRSAAKPPATLNEPRKCGPQRYANMCHTCI
jgi:hypothetical protein